ncbi:procathepsin L-like [Chiloscyllium plagiosum]|uniref:procathepsin L-like n=1 Tax=Chiloscyllium plagiosum TaxID=36176 RepID=UPI001CB7B8E3|nr:procathepsin L-like [Chiloscyllium plagiosum]
MVTLIIGYVEVCILALASGSPFDPTLDDGWNNWKSFHNKQYEEHEKDYRRLVWEDNGRYIEQHNLEHAMGKHTFTVGMNQFGDLTFNEFRQLLSASSINEAEKMSSKVFTAQQNIQLPSTVDWRPKGYVTSVKDQGQCGSCWAFSATGVLEGQVFNKTGKLISLSEQYLMDCSRAVGNAGCNGGSVLAGFLFIKEKGITSEQSYPYTAKVTLLLSGNSWKSFGSQFSLTCFWFQDGNCTFNQSDIVATCKGAQRIPSGSEVDLAAAVATVGPISAGIDAEHRSFMLYKSGIFYEPRCSTTKLDHGILVVGYGTENQKPFWIVKNSWGASWGNRGYVHMAKDMDNNCGIASNAVYPEV